MVEISLSGSGEGPGGAIALGPTLQPTFGPSPRHATALRPGRPHRSASSSA